jgi:two-component system alkaline phosphatase synthesis response regulator PhoP
MARRVLVVDDSIDTAHSMKVLVREMGHEVEYAINGYAALDIAGRFCPEIIVLDMLLPDFDGADLSRLLRLKLAPKPVRILAITGRGGEEAQRRAKLAGCDEFLLKPLDPKVLEYLLNRT